VPLTDPTTARDNTADWFERFRAIRVEALRPRITPELIEEHRNDPRGPHSNELQLVLNFVRGPAFEMEGKPFVYIAKPYREYRVGMMTPRGKEAVVLEEETFATEREAQHAVFLRRLAAHGLDQDLEGSTRNV
jgi:hypothetical protein